MGQQQDPRFQMAPGPFGFRVPRAQATSADVLAPASVFPSATDPFEAFGEFASPLPAPGPYDRGTQVPQSTTSFMGSRSTPAGTYHTGVPETFVPYASPIGGLQPEFQDIFPNILGGPTGGPPSPSGATQALSPGMFPGPFPTAMSPEAMENILRGQNPSFAASIPVGGVSQPGGAQQLGGLPGQGLSGAIQAILANPGVFPTELARTLAPEELAILIPFFESQQLFAEQQKVSGEDLDIAVGDYLDRIAQGDSDRNIAADMLQLAQDTFERTGVDTQATLDQLLIEFEAEQTFRLEQQGFQADQAAAQATFRTTQLEGELEGRTATAEFRTEEQRLQAIQDAATGTFRTAQQEFQAIESGATAQFRADQLQAQKDEAVRTAEFRLENLSLQQADIDLRREQGEETIEVAREELQLQRDIAAIDEELARAGLLETERDRLMRERLGIEQNVINRARVTAEERRIDVEAATALAVQESRSRTSLQQAALENPFGFAALNTLGGFPGAGGTAQPTQGPSSFQAGLGPLGFQVPQGVQAGQTGPASQFFQGGNIPTLGALQQIGPDALQFLSSILGFTGTSPQAFGQQSAGVTPGTQPQFQLPQLLGGVQAQRRG